jgi:uncharacterized protein (DUF433 family)
MKFTIAETKPPLSVDADGVIRINNTRVTLRTLITAHKQGATPEEIGEQFPTLNLADIYLTIGYYLIHASEIDEYLSSQEQLADELRRQSESSFRSSDLYQRLLNAKNSKRGDTTPR